MKICNFGVFTVQCYMRPDECISESRGYSIIITLSMRAPTECRSTVWVSLVYFVGSSLRIRLRTNAFAIDVSLSLFTRTRKTLRINEVNEAITPHCVCVRPFSKTENLVYSHTLPPSASTTAQRLNGENRVKTNVHRKA